MSEDENKTSAFNNSGGPGQASRSLMVEHQVCICLFVLVCGVCGCAPNKGVRRDRMRGDRDLEYIICLHACTNVYISTAAGTHTFIHILLLPWQIDMSIKD